MIAGTVIPIVVHVLLLLLHVAVVIHDVADDFAASVDVVVVVVVVAFSVVVNVDALYLLLIYFYFYLMQETHCICQLQPMSRT